MNQTSMTQEIATSAPVKNPLSRFGRWTLALLAGLFALVVDSGARADSFDGLIRTFKRLTDVKQDRWNDENEGRYTVEGSGKVETVEEAGFMSEIECDCYEVTIEVGGVDRAVVFVPKYQRSVADLDVGQRVRFSGRLKKMRNWGFWISGYIENGSVR